MPEKDDGLTNKQRNTSLRRDDTAVRPCAGNHTETVLEGKLDERREILRL